MTNNEKEIIQLIRNYPNREYAIKKVVEIISMFANDNEQANSKPLKSN